jgi:hypothetical protein
VRLLIDTIMLAAIFALALLAASAVKAAPPCERWYETRDGRDIQTSEPVNCDGALGPVEQFAELLKCADADLPACEVRRQAESDKAEKVETALRKDVQIEKTRADKHAAENAKMRDKLEELATVEVYEHPAFWAGVGAAAMAVVWIIVEVVR